MHDLAVKIINQDIACKHIKIKNFGKFDNKYWREREKERETNE